MTCHLFVLHNAVMNSNSVCTVSNEKKLNEPNTTLVAWPVVHRRCYTHLHFLALALHRHLMGGGEVVFRGGTEGLAYFDIYIIKE